MARVKSALRRYTSLGSISSEESNIYSTGSLVVNDDTKQVFVDDEEVKLTPIEFNILKLLVSNAGRVYSSDQIYENIVAVHIRHIREKIEIDPKNPRFVKVVWGIGYKAEKM